MSVRGEISTGFRNRLKTITTGNGYSTDVKEVYFDKIPMGMNLQQGQLPAILFIQGVDNTSSGELGGCMIGDWEIELQLWHCGGIGDLEMNNFERDIYKAIYADSATAKTNAAFRGIHKKITKLSPDRIVADLNMIESNRVSCLFFRVEYRTPLHDL